MSKNHDNEFKPWLKHLKPLSHFEGGKIIQEIYENPVDSFKKQEKELINSPTHQWLLLLKKEKSSNPPSSSVIPNPFSSPTSPAHSDVKDHHLQKKSSFSGGNSLHVSPIWGTEKPIQEFVLKIPQENHEVKLNLHNNHYNSTINENDENSDFMSVSQFSNDFEESKAAENKKKQTR